MKMGQQETAETFLRRKQKNLDFFQRRFPDLFRRFSNLVMQRVELVVSPVEKDVDMHINGKSLYGGCAKHSALQEVEQFLGSYPPGKRLQTVVPPLESNHSNPRFAAAAFRSCLRAVSENAAQFNGYPMPNFIPSLVFLGCGLGYHIDALTERVDVVNALVFEPDEEQFAASLFTVEWETICKRFLDRKGYDIKFIIGTTHTETELRNILESNLNQKLPLYPVFTLYFNHRRSAAGKKTISDVRKDLPKLFANWGTYDDEMIRLNNTAFNLREAPLFLLNDSKSRYNRPVVIAGSGPSIDDRIETIRACRDNITLVSAGTGLKGLIGHGIKPDYHVEVDPHYIIYQLLSDIGKENLRGITLIAVNEINARVPSLFDNVFFYAKVDNPAPRVFGLEQFAFKHCNPTCTNAAFAVFQQLGFRNFFLFGTDYGFRDRVRHHSDHSVYGSRDENSQISRLVNDVAQKRFVEGKLMNVESVDGGTVFTRPDYFSAKRSVEDLLSWAKSNHPDLSVRNCADGAVITGADWLPKEEFEPLISELSKQAEEQSTLDILSHTAGRYDAKALNKQLKWVQGGIDQRARALRKLLAEWRLRGKKDLTRLITALIKELLAVRIPKGYSLPQAEQLMARHLLWGSVSQFLHGGFCYTMAADSGDDVEAARVAGIWRDSFLKFLGQIDNHFQNIIINGVNGEGERWLSQTVYDAETSVVEAS